MGSKRKSLAERFWAKVRKAGPDECWIWTGCVQTNTGYGRIGVGGRDAGVENAHRVSYRLAHGDIPEGMVVRHRCASRYVYPDRSYGLCVNPAHLEIGTCFDNSQDRRNDKRSPWGSRHSGMKYSDEMVARMHELKNQGLNHAEIAREVGGITRRYAARILTGKRRARKTAGEEW